MPVDNLTRSKTVPAPKAVVVRKNVASLKNDLRTLAQSLNDVHRDIPDQSTVATMSEMGETESLRLQMALDRLSKMMSTLSNLLKKVQDTQSNITKNLK